METIGFNRAVKIINASTCIRYEDEEVVDFESSKYFADADKPAHIDGEFIAMMGQGDDEIILSFTPNDTFELHTNGIMRIESDEEGVHWLYLFK